MDNHVPESVTVRWGGVEHTLRLDGGQARLGPVVLTHWRHGDPPWCACAPDPPGVIAEEVNAGPAIVGEGLTAQAAFDDLASKLDDLVRWAHTVKACAPEARQA